MGRVTFSAFKNACILNKCFFKINKIFNKIKKIFLKIKKWILSSFGMVISLAKIFLNKVQILLK